MFDKILALATSIWSLLFKPVAGSVSGVLLPHEVARASAVGAGSGALVGIALAALNALLPVLPTLIKNPVVAALVTTLVTTLIGLLGQVNQSQTRQTYIPDRTYEPPAWLDELDLRA